MEGYLGSTFLDQTSWILRDEELEREAKQNKRIFQVVPTQPELIDNEIIDEATWTPTYDAWTCVMQVVNMKSAEDAAPQLAHFCGSCKTVLYYLSLKLQDVCDEESFEANCPPSSVIVIKDAEYGHLALSRCTSIDTGHFGCRRDALDIISARCTGRQSCKVSSEDSDLKALKPCVRGLVVYLHVEHLCVAAQPVDPCAPISVGSSPSFISSFQASTAPCKRDPIGSLQMYLRAKLGQRVSMTSVNLRPDNVSSIAEVGYVLDEGEDEVKAIRMDGKGKVQQESPVFESVSNEVTLALHSNHNRHFLVVFEAQGCEDLKLSSSDLWIERHGETASVGCTSSQRMWTLQCKAGRWSGVIGNCTQDVEAKVDALQMNVQVPLALPKDIVLMLIVGLTVIVALVIVTTGYVCYKRYYQQQLRPMQTKNRPVDYDPAYSNTISHSQHRGTPEAVHPLLVPNGSTLMRSNMAAPTQQPEVHIWEHPLPVPPPHSDIYSTGTLRSVRNEGPTPRPEHAASQINSILINTDTV
ncbi:hypothetical protein CAPTEDRAFT_229014 [Capitella teleta]|uniref:SUEL-type lectin domain-containing protein n=1 Tax=Capitella teleta TaxID=283909 RepID=R7UP01_CAPTE|nr:hypothetical protein CAPTEDRAFT_229014 [Capitella teleta]|eukprot:ELU05657.1 hypothetical protein CAPTEDRAFT_229014 [Capitella teleta]